MKSFPPEREQLINLYIDAYKRHRRTYMWVKKHKKSVPVKIINNPNNYPIIKGELLSQKENQGVIEVIIYVPISKTKGHMYKLFLDDIEIIENKEVVQDVFKGKRVQGPIR